MRRKIKKLEMALVFAAVLAVCRPGVCLAGGNQLCDAGFEQSDANGGFPDSGCWSQKIGDTGVAGCAAFAARTGGNGLFQYTGFATDQRETALEQELPCAAGRRYFASAWVNPGWDGFWWLTGSQAYIKVEFLDCAGTILAQYNSKPVKTSDAGWTLLYFATNPAPYRTCFLRYSLILEKPDLVGLSFAGFDDCILREIECTDCVRFNEIPECGSDALLKGSVIGVNPNDYKIGVYIFVDDWRPKPLFGFPWTEINIDGTWQCDISWYESDLRATEIMAFLVPKNETADWPVDFNNPAGLAALPGEAFRFPSAGAFRPGCFESVPFAGYNWLIKDSVSRPVNPGNNYFDHNNVWVDAEGMHLKITKVGDQWRCAEVFTERSLGGGTYRFVVDSNTALLDPSVVLGLFTWDEFAPHYSNREMDIEISRWGDPFADNAQYVIQPAEKTGNVHRFNIDPCDLAITHILDWGFGVAGFESFYGVTRPASESDLIESWVVTGEGVPRPGSENVRINLWLDGEPPTDGNEVEVVIRDFEVTPCFYDVSPSELDFGPVLISKATVRPIMIANGQCIPYVVALSVSGADANYFYVADRAFSLEPGSDKRIDVTFIPDTNRVFEAALEITSTTGVVSVPLSGRGSRIAYTRVPAIGSEGYLEGQVSGVNPSDYRVVSYIFDSGTWYIKPTCIWGGRSNNPLVRISSSGDWRCNIDVGLTDKAATEAASYLVPKTADYPPCVLDSPDDSRMSGYSRVRATKPRVSISKVIAKAGSAAGDDAITIDGWYFISMNELLSADKLILTIKQSDKVLWSQSLDFDAGKFISRGVFSYAKNGVSVKFDNQWMLRNSYAGKFRLALKNADLTCLSSPVTLAVRAGDFDEQASADEGLDPAIINGKQAMPIKFLAGCSDAIRIDKLTVKQDCIYIKGAIVFKNEAPDLTIEDVSVGWGQDTFAVPAGSFVRTSGTQPKYRCKKVVTAKGVVEAFFDFKAGLFSVKISKAKLDAQPEVSAFNIVMAGFSEGISARLGETK